MSNAPYIIMVKLDILHVNNFMLISNVLLVPRSLFRGKDYMITFGKMCTKYQMFSFVCRYA